MTVNLTAAARGHLRAESRRRAAIISLGAGVLLALVGIIAFAYAGGTRWFTVTTPSMGTTAPVGSLVVTQPVPVREIGVGDIVTFRNGVGKVYSHRVVATDGHALTTQGDLNGSPDPGVVTQANLIGKAVYHARYLGWVAKGMPVLVAGWAGVALLSRIAVPRVWRHRAQFLGDILVVDAVALWLKPFTGAVALYFTTASDGMSAAVVSTGILPIRVMGAPAGSSADLHLGQFAHIAATQADAAGRYHFVPTVHMSWAWWLCLILVCLAPLGWSALAGFAEADPAPDPVSAPGTRPTLRHLAGPPLHSFTAVVIVAIAVGILVGNTQASFTARISNSADTAGTRTFFTCLDAMRAFTSASPATGLHGHLYEGYTLGNGTGISGSTDQGTVGPWNATLTGVTQVSGPTPGIGCVTDWNKRSQNAIHLDGSTSRIDAPAGSSVTNVTPDPGDTSDMTFQVWFRTPAQSAAGGVLSCLADSTDTCVEQALYVDAGGHLNYYENGAVITAGSVNDGNWHMAVAQIDNRAGSAGMRLWLDGVLVGTNPSVTYSKSGIMYPQWGYSAGTQAWKNWPQSHLHFLGDMQMVAIYGTDSTGAPLGQTEITKLYESARP